MLVGEHVVRICRRAIRGGLPGAWLRVQGFLVKQVFILLW